VTEIVSPRPIVVRVVETEAEFASLVDTWEAMQAGAVIGSVFESHDWQHLWWRSYGKGQPLKVLVATEDGAPTGLLALYIQTEVVLRVPVRLLRFVGTGGDTSPDDLGPVLAPGREAETARALADAAMAIAGWDVLLLTDLNPACPFTKAIETAARASGHDVLTGQSERIAYIDLPATYEAWLQSLSRDRRYRIKNLRKKLNAAHPARFFVWDDPATIDQGIDRLIFLHRKRWQKIGLSHGFSSTEYVTFHRALMKACLGRDRLRLYALELAGEVGAMYYFYKFRDRVYLMQSGFDPDLSDVKPGQVLLGHIIEHAIGEGQKVLDFLKGDHRYKEELSSGERETLFVTAFRLTPRALVYRLRRVFLPAAKAQFLENIRRLRPVPAKAD